MNRLCGAAVAVLLAGAVACSSSSAGGSQSSTSGQAGTFTATVKVRIYGTDGFTAKMTPGTDHIVTGNPCQGAGPNADLQAGTEVEISNAAGVTLRKVTLAAGVVGGSGDACFFNATTDLPPGETKYGVVIGLRDRLEFTEAELRNGPTITVDN